MTLEQYIETLEKPNFKIEVDTYELLDLLKELKRSRELIKRGEWTWNSVAIFGNPYGSYECSKCGNRVDFKYNYCCLCGAEMKNAE